MSKIKRVSSRLIGSRLLTKQAVADILAVRAWSIDNLRRTDPTFPAPAWITDGRPRWLPDEVHAWIKTRKRGGVAPAWRRQHQRRRRRCKNARSGR